MRTTLNLDDALIRAVKKHAAERGVTMTQVIEEALWAALKRPPSSRDAITLQWPTVRGRRAPDFDIADRDALYERIASGPDHG